MLVICHMLSTDKASKCACPRLFVLSLSHSSVQALKSPAMATRSSHRQQVGSRLLQSLLVKYWAAYNSYTDALGSNKSIFLEGVFATNPDSSQGRCLTLPGGRFEVPVLIADCLLEQNLCCYTMVEIPL